jgi:hypothetical protein
LTENPGYNDRLFQKGFRAQIHLARFAWLREAAAVYSTHNELKVLELGCYDGRSIDWLPVKPSLYDGFDANWEGGLEIGRTRFAGDERVRFHLCSSPVEMKPLGDAYDIGISLETMEHVPPDMVEDYLAIFARVVKTAVFFSVPNEIGLPFFGKFLAKKVIYRDSKDEPYAFSEFLNETLGQTHNVHRSEHKGFDYRRFLQQVESKFKILRMESIPYNWLPPGLSFTVGIVAEPKRF